MKTKVLLAFVTTLLLFSSCEDEEINKADCDSPVSATLRDFTGLDGCGFVFELEDGTRLEPVRIMLFCGTPPLPKEVTEDPLYGFEFVDGKKVKIGYKEWEDSVSICMAGPIVKINCIEEEEVTPQNE